MKIVFASHNPGKIKELQALVKKKSLDIIPQGDLDVEEVEETGLTFVENALIKARHAAQKTGLPAIADDSGLVVPALLGEPGIYSARYAGYKVEAALHIQKLLNALRDVPEENRSAYFHCTLVYLRHPKDPVPLISEGNWHGKILFEPRGEKGFGYDPIFWDEEKNCSAAEMPSSIKNEISHRGKALEKLLSLF